MAIFTSNRLDQGSPNYIGQVTPISQMNRYHRPPPMVKLPTFNINYYYSFGLRYHSFYPWHAGGDYKHLITEQDDHILQAVLEFNKYDLYTKSAAVPDIEELWPYYERLIDKYIPGELEW
ncbi:Inositol oxygenase [Papilio machaon]|uniref:Inositol oxygenase n=1 Tax=Papilio machaon TaxID=76193 RepID=A0A0N1PGH8_PAPMA|nr:Inositol oxygenase [Papilio machaon]